MKKVVAITQRVEVVANRGERRDALDQRWADFLSVCGLAAFPVANRPEAALDGIEAIDPAGLILTGGNDLAHCGGDAPERDATERMLIDWARARHRPIMAVCRGVQMLADMFGTELVRLNGHAGTRHEVILAAGDTREVNSYHNWGLTALPTGFDSWAATRDGAIEAIRHRDEPIMGMLWHPERESPFHSEDIVLFQKVFGVAR